MPFKHWLVLPLPVKVFHYFRQCTNILSLKLKAKVRITTPENHIMWFLLIPTCVGDFFSLCADVKNVDFLEQLQFGIISWHPIPQT